MPYFADEDKAYKIDGSMGSTDLDITLKKVEISKVIKELQRIKHKLKLEVGQKAFVTCDKRSGLIGIVIGEETNL